MDRFNQTYHIEIRLSSGLSWKKRHDCFVFAAVKWRWSSVIPFSPPFSNAVALLLLSSPTIVCQFHQRHSFSYEAMPGQSGECEQGQQEDAV